MNLFTWIQRQYTRQDSNACQKIWDDISAYVDGEATPDAARRVEGHLTGCGSCSAGLEFLRSSSKSFHSVAEVEPPDGLRDAILRRIRTERPARHTAIFPTVVTKRIATYGGLLAAGAAAAWTVLVVTATPTITEEKGSAITIPQPRIAETGPVQPALPERGSHPNAAEKREALPGDHVMGRYADASHVTPRKTSQRERHLLLVSNGVDRPHALPGKPVAAAKPAAPEYKLKIPTTVVAGDSLDTVERKVDEGEKMAAAKMPTSTNPLDNTAASGPKIEPAVLTTPSTTRIVLAAASTVLPSDKIASLAGLKRSLQAQKPAWRLPDAGQNARDRLIQIDLVRGTF